VRTSRVPVDNCAWGHARGSTIWSLAHTGERDRRAQRLGRGQQVQAKAQYRRNWAARQPVAGRLAEARRWAGHRRLQPICFAFLARDLSGGIRQAAGRLTRHCTNCSRRLHYPKGSSITSWPLASGYTNKAGPAGSRWRPRKAS